MEPPVGSAHMGSFPASPRLQVLGTLQCRTLQGSSNTCSFFWLEVLPTGLFLRKDFPLTTSCSSGRFWLEGDPSGHLYRAL